MLRSASLEDTVRGVARYFVYESVKKMPDTLAEEIRATIAREEKHG